MDSKTDQTFSDFITDKDGDYSKAQFMALAEKLLREGRRPGRVFLAMLRAAYASSIAHSTEEHYDFVRFASQDVLAWKDELEPILDQMIAEEKAKNNALDS